MGKKIVAWALLFVSFYQLFRAAAGPVVDAGGAETAVRFLIGLGSGWLSEKWAPKGFVYFAVKWVLLAVLALLGGAAGCYEGSVTGWIVMAAAVGYLIVYRPENTDILKPGLSQEPPGRSSAYRSRLEAPPQKKRKKEKRRKQVYTARGGDGDGFDWEAYDRVSRKYELEREIETLKKEAARARKAYKKAERENAKRADELAWQRAIEFFEGFEDD